jgi:hypothetical protein
LPTVTNYTMNGAGLRMRRNTSSAIGNHSDRFDEFVFIRR